MNDFNNGFYEEPEITPKTDLTSAKKVFSRIGIALCAVILAVYVTQNLLVIVLKAIGQYDLLKTSTGMWLATFVPQYCIAVPIGLLVMKKAPSSPLEKHEITIGQLFSYLCIAFFLMNTGNYIGTFLSFYLSKGTAENALSGYAMDTNPLKIVVMVILAPLLEEYIFRKQIIDKTAKYGEKTAVIFSGLLFGLFHTNMFQFFYAFFVGMLFSYVYLRTGRLIYTVILHGVINFCGSVIAPYIISKIDFDAVNKIATLDPNKDNAEILELMTPMMPGLSMLMAYTAISFGLAIAGMIFLLLRRKRLRWNPASEQLPYTAIANTVYMNWGIVVFITVTVSLTVVSIFLS